MKKIKALQGFVYNQKDIEIGEVLEVDEKFASFITNLSTNQVVAVLIDEEDNFEISEKYKDVEIADIVEFTNSEKEEDPFVESEFVDQEKVTDKIVNKEKDLSSKVKTRKK